MSNSLTVPPITVPVHRLTRYLRVRLGVTDGMLQWEVPRTVLGVVPIGVRHLSVPVADIQSLRVRRVVRPLSLLVGTAMVAVPLILRLWWVAVPMTVAGIWVILVALGPRLEGVTYSGTKLHADVCPGHEIDAELYMAAVNDIAEEARRDR